MSRVTDAADHLRDRGYLVTSETQPRTWTVALPAGIRLLSQNSRLHWAEKGRIVRDIRRAAFVVSRNARIPPLERASVVIEYQPPPTTRRRDHDNIPAASGKPAVDGALVDARVLKDDCPPYLTEITCRVGEPFPRGRLVLYITEEESAATGNGTA
jgi:crossover junction endodeoxyribonuclease RusA